MTSPSEQPRFLENEAEDVESALAELLDRSKQGDQDPQASDHQGQALPEDMSDTRRTTLKAQLSSTWIAGASFEKWLKDAATRMGG